MISSFELSEGWHFDGTRRATCRRFSWQSKTPGCGGLSTGKIFLANMCQILFQLAEFRSPFFKNPGFSEVTIMSIVDYEYADKDTLSTQNSHILQYIRISLNENGISGTFPHPWPLPYLPRRNSRLVALDSRFKCSSWRVLTQRYMSLVGQFLIFVLLHVDLERRGIMRKVQSLLKQCKVSLMLLSNWVFDVVFERRSNFKKTYKCLRLYSTIICLRSK